MKELLSDLSVKDRNAAERVLSLVVEKGLLRNLATPEVPLGVVPVTDLALGLKLMVSDEGLDQQGQEYFDYFPDVFPGLISEVAYALPREERMFQQAEARKVSEQVSIRVIDDLRSVTAQPPISDWINQAADRDQNTVEHLASILVNEVDAYIGALVKMCFLDQLNNHPVMEVSLSILEAGSLPCGWLSENEDRANYQGALCAIRLGDGEIAGRD